MASVTPQSADRVVAPEPRPSAPTRPGCGLLRASCFDLGWHVFRGPLQGANAGWTHLSWVLAAAVCAAALCTLIGQTLRADVLQNGNAAGAAAAVLTFHASVEVAAFGATLGFEGSRSRAVW